MHARPDLRPFALALALTAAGCGACGGGATAIDARPAPDATVDADTGPPRLRLIEVRDHVDGAFTSPRTVTADDTRIYLGSRLRGVLFVLDRDPATGFATRERINVATAGLASVWTDADRVYAFDEAGVLHVYRKGSALAFDTSQRLAPRGFSSDAAAIAGAAIVGDGSVRVAADDARVWVSPLNQDDAADAFALPGLAARAHYAPPFDPTRVFRFDRATGDAIGSLPAPLNLGGQPNAPNVAVGHGKVALFVPGCCGAGVELYDAVTHAHVATIDRPWANAVAWSGDYLIVGGEDGAVDLWDVDGAAPALLDRLDLRQLTGHTGSEDIEIRALWTDAHDRLVFAGSSWGNDSSRSLELPSFFVLARTGT